MDTVEESHVEEETNALPNADTQMDEKRSGRVARLKRRLQASRKATRLIFAADDPTSLIERTCRNLVSTLGYSHAWIALLAEDGKSIARASVAGLGTQEQAMRDRLVAGRCSEFMRKAADAQHLLVMRESLRECEACPLSDQYATCAGLARGLRFAGKLYGVVSVSVSSSYAHDPEEQDFFSEMADDVALALYRMEKDNELRLAMGIVHNSPTVALVWENSRERPVRYASDNAWQLLGYAAEDLVTERKAFADLVHPDDLAQVLRETDEASRDLEATTVPHQPYRIVTESGEVKWVQDMTTIERTEDGDVESYRGLLLDISERKQAEERLLQSERFLDSLVNGIADPIFVKDEQHRWIALNDAFCEMFGRSKEEMLWKSDIDFFPQEQVDVFWEHDDKVLASDEVDINEEEITGPQGLRTISTIKSAFTDPSTGRRVLVGTIRDITERKAAEDALRASEAELRKAQRIAKLGSWVADLKTRMIYASEEMINLFRHEGAESDGVPIDEWKKRIHPDDAERIEEAIARARSGEAPFDLEYRIVRDDGTVRTLHAQGKYIRDASGVAVRMEGTGQDVTERRQVQEELRSSRNRFHSIFDQTFQFAGIIALNGQVVDVNQTALSFIDTPLDAVVGDPFWLTPWWGHDTDQQVWLKESIFQAAQGSGVQREVTHMSALGELHYFDFSLKPVNDEDGAAEYLIAESRDVTGRKLADERTKRLFAQQVAINDLSAALGDEHGLDSIYRTIHEHVSRMMDATGLRISLVDLAEDLLRPAFAIDGMSVLNVADLPGLRIGDGDSPSSKVVLSGVPLRTGASMESCGVSEANPSADESVTPRGEKPRTCLLAPMKIGGAVVGVLRVESPLADAYSQEDESLLGGLANVAAIAIENSRLQAKSLADAADLRAAFRGTIEILARATERRDPYTASHQLRVALLSSEIAKELGLSEERIESVRIAAMVHDIGKLSIPAEILSRPSTLNAMEYELVQSHVETAYEILKTIEFPWPVADIVSQHHERLDGSGYPNGLKDDEIILEAQIIGVADVVEAMSNHRPYRPSLGIDAALQEIESKKGICFGTQVVDACLRLYEAGFKLPDDILP